MIPMTVNEVIALERKNDRELVIDVHRESPFQIKYHSSCESFPVAISGLPEIRDMPKADAARAQAAYLAVRDLTYQYLKILKAHEASWDAQRQRDTLIAVLQQTMAPKPFLAAMLAVSADIDQMHRGIDEWLKRRNAA